MAEFAPLIDVTAVTVLGGYEVALTFENGETRTLDLEPLMWGEMFEPMRRDYETFLRLAVDPQAGTIVWPNGADLSPRTLYAQSVPAVSA